MGLSNMNQPPLPTQPQPTGVLFLVAPPTKLAVNVSVTLDAETVFPMSSAALNNDTLVTYSMSCGSSSACGTFSSSDEMGAIVYTAPAAVPAGGTVTITATSVANGSLSTSAAITITPPVPIAVSFFATPPASLIVGSQAPLRALIANDTTSNPQVKWSIACGANDCGSLSVTQTTSEAATTYTAPAAIPSGGSVTVTATSVTDSTKSASASIVIQPVAAQLADGTYVFQIDGLNSIGTTYATGVFVASSGAIVSGEQDTIYDGGEYSLFSTITGGRYAPMPDGNVQISLNVPNANVPEVLEGTLISGGHGFVAGVQGVVGTGTLDLQSSMAAPSGGYSILLTGGSLYDSTPPIGGILNVDGPGTISGTGSILDAAELYNPSPLQLNASSVSAPDAYGRVVFQLNFAPNALVTSMFVAGYVIDSAHIRLVLAGDPSNSYDVLGDLGGLAVGQGTNAGAFTTASVAGSSWVFAAEGSDQKGSLQLAATCTLNANGAVSGVLNWNDLSGGTGQSPVAFHGTYKLDVAGRLTLSNLTDGANFNYSLNLYLDGKGGGLVLSDDINDQFAGQAFARQTTAFSASSLSGRYGISAGLSPLPNNGTDAAAMLTGWLTSTPSGGSDALSGYADVGSGAQDFALTGTLASDPSGVFQGQVSGLSAVLSSPGAAPSSTSNSFTLFMIDSTQGILIETDNAQLLLGRMQLAQ